MKKYKLCYFADFHDVSSANRQNTINKLKSKLYNSYESFTDNFEFKNGMTKIKIRD